MGVLFLISCSKDVTKQISVDEANLIAFEEIYGKETNVTINQAIFQTDKLMEGGFFVYVEKGDCLNIINIRHDGKIVDIKNGCSEK